MVALEDGTVSARLASPKNAQIARIEFTEEQPIIYHNGASIDVDQAKLDLEARVAFHAGRLDLRARRISLRDQASRWGSCSTTGLLSFSWRLILAPPIVLDYVAAHEVAHLAEMNHGPRFWALVAKTMPEMRSAKAWLYKTVAGME